ncbi:MAG TPA: nuclear transport factor 2 family protein [Longimicrobiales bacterium]
MRRTSLLLAVLAAAACGSAGPGSPEPRHDDVVAVLMASADAWNRGDLAAFMEPYEPGERVSFAGRDRFISGYSTIEDIYRRGYWGDRAAPADSLSYEILELRPLDDGAALLLGRFRLSDRQTGVVNSTGIFSTVWVHTEDGWKMTHDHTSGS